MLSLRVLGGFQLTHFDQPVKQINQARQQSLLTYLVLNCRIPQSRQHVAFLFWPDSKESQARTNLRRELHRLRHALPHGHLHVDAQSVQWLDDESFECDATEFRLLLDGETDLPQSALEAAIALYGGSLLPGCYDEWLLAIRRELEERYAEALTLLVAVHESKQEFSKAIGYARKVVGHDPLQETNYQRLMRLHLLANDRSSALRTFHECSAVLRRELGVDPSPETVTIHDRVLRTDTPIPAPRESKFDLAAESTFVGRRDELTLLQSTWRSLSPGRMHLCLISGEAGIGKTRLADEFLKWAKPRNHLIAAARSYQVESRLAYAPVSDLLRTEPLSKYLKELPDVWLTEVARLIPELLEERPELVRSQALAERWQHQHFLAALVRAVLLPDRPTIFKFDDIQWCDDETLEWIHYLMRTTLSAKVMILVTLRSDETPTDGSINTLLINLRREGQTTEIPLQPLTANETKTLATAVSNLELDDNNASALYRNTAGNPLFVVETIRAGLARSGMEYPGEKFSFDRLLETQLTSPEPPRVQAVIDSRLSQLSADALSLAEVASIVGRSFTIALLNYAGEQSEEATLHSLDELWQRRIIAESESGSYDFSHDKIRDAVYTGVGSVKRVLIHRRVANALVIQHASDLDEISSHVAFHFEQGRQLDMAVGYYIRAGAAALTVSANAEAIRLLRRGLKLVSVLPYGPERCQQELTLQTILGVPLVASLGYAAVEVGAVYRRAVALSEELGRRPDPPVLRALSSYALTAADLQESDQLGKQLLDLGRSEDDAVVSVEGHYVLGVTAFWRGEFMRSAHHLRQAIVEYDPDQVVVHTSQYSQDPYAVCLCRLAYTLWFLGHPDQAMDRCIESVDAATTLGHPFTQAYILTISAWIHSDLGDMTSTLRQAEAALELCRQYDIRYWLIQAQLLCGWAEAGLADKKRGIDMMRQSFSDYEKTGSQLLWPVFHARLADAYIGAGQTASARSELHKARGQMMHYGNRWYEAEILRLEGDVYCRQTASAQAAESCYLRALQVANQQSAGMLEKRAAKSLSLLWQELGKEDEAHRMLDGDYDLAKIRPLIDRR